MILNVTINGGFLTCTDILELNALGENRSVCFDIIEVNNFLPPEVGFILIEISKEIAPSILVNTLYDMLKFTLHSILGKLSNKKHNNTVQFEIICNNNKFSLNCNFPLTDEQKDKLVDAATQKLLNNESMG